MELEGRVAVVTGGGTGIGRAVCLRLARGGAAAVVVNYSRSEAGARSTTEELEALGSTASAHRADIAREAQVVSMIGDTGESFGRLVHPVNHAGPTHCLPHR